MCKFYELTKRIDQKTKRTRTFCWKKIRFGEKNRRVLMCLWRQRRGLVLCLDSLVKNRSSTLFFLFLFSFFSIFFFLFFNFGLRLHFLSLWLIAWFRQGWRFWSLRFEKLTAWVPLVLWRFRLYRHQSSNNFLAMN